MLKSGELKGILVPVVAPFLENGALDLDSLERHIANLVAAGVQGIVVNGTTGECPTITAEELRKMTEAARNVIGESGVKLVLGTGSNDTVSTVRKTEEAAELGADAALVVVPYYSKPSQQGIIEHYRHVSQVGLPLIVYEIPYRTGVQLTVDTLRTVMEEEQVIGLKDSSGGTQLIMELSRFETKPIFCGEDAYFFASLCCGASGGILASANVNTEHFIKIYAQAAAGHFAQAKRLFEELAPLIRLLFAEPNPAPLKYLLAQRKILANDQLRLPMTRISEALQQELQAYV